MQFLTPLTALVAAAVALPLLLLLYFLKLKRRELIVSSTLLWKRAVQDLQVNAPFQRLRNNILLLLQLLMLLALLLALAAPILSLMSGRARRHVLLIDHSASMSATDVEPSRLEEAKRQARIYVESLRDEGFLSFRGARDQTMVIAFDKHSKVMCNFTADKRQLIAAIDSIQAGDGDSYLGEAIMVAQAFTQAPDDEPANQGSQETVKLMLFSDGQIADLDQIIVNTDELMFQCIGQSGRNVGVTAMRARRSYENPDEVEVFATVANYDAEPVTTDVQLSVNDDVRAVKSVTIPATGKGKADSGGAGPQGAGKVAVNFSLSYAEAGVLTVRQLRGDSLASDDAAWAVLAPPKRLTVLLVTAGNKVLESALRACSLYKLDIMTPSEFDANVPGYPNGDGSGLGLEQCYDVVALDNHLPVRTPRCRYLVFGRPPNGIDVSVLQELENQAVVDWRPRHAVLKYVNLTNLFAQKCYKLDLPRDAELLAEFNESPALALVRRNGSVFLLAPFDVLDSTWPFEPSFVLFCYNAVSFLGMQAGQNEDANLLVGDPIVVDGLVSGQSALVDGPGFSRLQVSANSSGSVRFARTDRVGVYGIRAAEPAAGGTRLFAVNMLNDAESNIEPVRQIVASGVEVQAQAAAVGRANLPLWPFFVGFVLFLACLEWFVYNRKVRI
ncbi:MAG: VWA domain-containing protein [Sedimentisphaerales bacterium]|nr:VWA domain-containing protein [Sedimentisphaerales bacterium]